MQLSPLTRKRNSWACSSEQAEPETEAFPLLNSPLNSMPSTANLNRKELLKRALRQTRNDPSRFNELVLRRPAYWKRQVEIALALARFKTVVVATGNEVGKSYFAAGAILWWLLTRKNSLVVATAPSQTLLGTVLYKEIRKAARSMRRAWPLDYKITESANASPQVFELADGWSCLGISTTGVERLSGQHNVWLFQVVDEASGILSAVWEALDSQDPYKRLVIGNPLTPDTHFHKLFKQGMEGWKDTNTPDSLKTVSFEISSLESPDIHLERSPRGLASRTFIIEAERNWGRGTPLWDAHVEGKFPKTASFALLTDFWISRAFDGEPDSDSWSSRDGICLSCDICAGVGADRFVLLIRNDYQILYLEADNQVTPGEAALRIARESNNWGIPQDKIIYDANGLGRDLPKYLVEYRIEQAIAYFGSGSGAGHRCLKFENARSLNGWRLRERLDPDAKMFMPPTELDRQSDEIAAEYERCQVGWMQRELAAHRTATRTDGIVQLPFHLPAAVLGEHAEYFHQELAALKWVRKPNGVIGLENKEDLVKRLKRSPDLADALIMSFAA